MEEMINEALGFFCLMWPISGVFMIYTIGAWIMQGQFLLCLIGIGTFAFVTIAIIVLSLYAE